MSFDKNVILQAEAEINQRRQKAESLLLIHEEEVYKNVPDIAEINNQLIKTSVELTNIIIKKSGNVNEAIESLKKTNLQGQEMIKELLRVNGYPKDYLDVKYYCEKCNDKGIYAGRRCDCFNELLSKYAVENLNKTCNLQLTNFNTFNLSYYSDVKDVSTGINPFNKMTENYEYCKDYANDFSLNSPSIFMLGKTGLGKTHLSLSIASEVIKKGFTVIYGSIQNFLRSIEREHFGKDNTGNTLDLLLSAQLLILDDLGSEYESSFYTSTIYDIINTRLNKGLPTIINSNLSTAELQKRYDDRIISRLLGMYDYLRFVGNDIRQIKRLNGEI